MSDDPVQTIVGVVIIAVVALVAVQVFAAVGGVGATLGTTSGDVSYDPTTGDAKTLDEDVDEAPEFFKISLTREHGIRLNGSGYVDAHAPGTWPGSGNWTACATGRLDSEFNSEAAYTLLAVDNETVTLHYDDGVWAGYHEKDNGDSARVTMPANSPTDWTALCVKRENDTDELLMYRDGSKSSSSSYGSASRPLGNDWNGDVDEVRFFDHAMADGEASTYGSEPVAGLGREDVARWMFEEGSGATTDAFFMDASATLEGDAQWGPGVENPDLQEGTDYDRGVDPLSVKPIAGGLIDGSPILYVEWATGLGGTLAAVMDGFGNAITLIPIVLLVLVASIAVAVIGRLRTQ